VTLTNVLCFAFSDCIEYVLSLVNCKVLQYGQSATTDTYVLSESSMFVFRTHFVLKTCGETTLLYAIEPMLQLARDYCGFDKADVRLCPLNFHSIDRLFLQQVFYSRRKFLRPELQKSPHTNFDEEVNNVHCSIVATHRRV
jgi:S-adenosylmethionine decarboxylase